MVRKGLVRFNGTLTEELYSDLKEMARLEERSFNSMVNRILKDYVDKYVKK